MSKPVYLYDLKAHAEKNRRRVLLALWWLRRRYRYHLLLRTSVDDTLRSPATKERLAAALRQDPTFTESTVSLHDLMASQDDQAEENLGRRLRRTDHLRELERRVRESKSLPLTEPELDTLYGLFTDLEKASRFTLLAQRAQRRASWVKVHQHTRERGLLQRSKVAAISSSVYTDALRALSRVDDIPFMIGSVYPFDEVEMSMIGLPPRQP